MGGGVIKWNLDNINSMGPSKMFILPGMSIASSISVITPGGYQSGLY